jgi:hypothetical protein
MRKAGGPPSPIDGETLVWYHEEYDTPDSQDSKPCLDCADRILAVLEDMAGDYEVLRC